MPIKLVLFDCDGVLVDSERVTNQVMRDDLAPRGLDLPLSEIMDLFVGGTMAGVMVKARELGADIPENWLDIIYPKIYAALENTVEAIDGIEAVLDDLDARGIPYGVGSNGRVVKMELTLGRTGLLPRFQGKLYSGQDLPRAKPFPDVYLKIAEDHGIAPKDCVVIEDSANGAKAGIAAGMKTFGFTRDTDPERLRPIVDHLFADMSELSALLFPAD